MMMGRNPTTLALASVALAAVALLGSIFLFRSEETHPDQAVISTAGAIPSDNQEQSADEPAAQRTGEERASADIDISKKELSRLIQKMRKMDMSGLDSEEAEAYNALHARFLGMGTRIQDLLMEIIREAKDRELFMGAFTLVLQVGDRRIALPLSEFLLGHEVLGEKGWGVGTFIARKLGEWNAPETLPNLREALFDDKSHYYLREEIVKILPGFGPEVAEPILTEALSDSSFSMVYAEIGEALAKVGTRSAADALVGKWESLWGKNGRSLGIEESLMLGAVGKFDPDLATRVLREFLGRRYSSETQLL